MGVDKDEGLGVWKAYGYEIFSGVTFHAATVQDALDGLREEIKKLVRDLPEKFGEYYFIS